MLVQIYETAPNNYLKKLFKKIHYLKKLFKKIHSTAKNYNDLNPSWKNKDIMPQPLMTYVDSN